MRTRTIKRFLYLCTLLALIVVSGCEDSQSQKNWNVFTNALEAEPLIVMPQNDWDDIIDSKFSDLKSVVNICEKNPQIRRVASNEEVVSYYGGDQSLETLKPAIMSAKEKLIHIGASSVSCGRRGDHQGNPLSTVSFVMYAVGLSVSGRLESIVYMTKWTVEQPDALTEEELKDRGFTPSKKQGWYVYTSQ